MIALQTASIKSIDDTVKWDGIDRKWKPWNKDHTMRTALPVSCVWFYKELARRIGYQKMQYWIQKSDYGNKKTGNKIDNFWLEGDLRISAKEQVLFLEKLIDNKLPFDIKVQETVKQLIITDSTKDYVLHSKTGWVGTIGWNVGYVETNKQKWIFAMNMDVHKPREIKFRKVITYEILRAANIID